MRLINLSDNSEVLSLAEVLARFPCKIFPAEASLISFDELGFAPVVEGIQPSVDEAEQRVALGAVELQNDEWVQTYFAVDLPAEEIAAARQQKRLQQYQAGKAVVELMLNQRAQERDYDTIHAAVIRAAYPGPYQQEGMAYGVWMDTCWQSFFALTAAAEGAGRPFPNDEEILAAMAVLTLPQND